MYLNCGRNHYVTVHMVYKKASTKNENKWIVTHIFMGTVTLLQYCTCPLTISFQDNIY